MMSAGTANSDVSGIPTAGMLAIAQKIGVLAALSLLNCTQETKSCLAPSWGYLLL